MSVAPPHELVLQGYLHKQSKHLKLWRIRYFMLTKNELTYSKKSGRKPRTLLPMNGVQVVDDQNHVRHPGNYVFELQTPTQKLFLSATTEQERRSWVSVLRRLQPGGYESSLRVTSDSVLLARNASDSVLNSTVTPMLQPHHHRGRGHKRASRVRRVERRQRRLPKLKCTFSEAWVEDMLPLPSGSRAQDVPLLEALCFAGIPKELRGRAWAWVLGNTLQVNEDLFRICKARAQAVRKQMSLKHEVDHSMLETPTTSTVSVSKEPESPAASSSSSSSSEASTQNGEVSRTTQSSENQSSAPVLPVQDILLDAVGIAEMLVAHGERSIRLVNIDMPRTFGHHPLFQPGAEGTERTTEVLEAYICYRPDLGYVQGMSYLAAVLCFHMDSFSAFKAMVALMSTSLLFDMFRLEATRTFHYISVYNQILEYELPTLAGHFQEIGIDAQMYAVDWALTLFTRSLPLDLALRLWDCYVLLGTPFFFQASMGLLSLFQDALLGMEAEGIMQLLHNFPKTTSSRELFEAIASVRLSCQEITELLAGGKLWSPDATREVAVTFPEAYEYA